MNIAAQILSDFEVFEAPENACHKHEPEEKADRFRAYSIDPASTEREYAELIYTLVRVMKPMNVVELGTGLGITSLLCAAAVKQNRQGSVTTVDTRYLNPLKILAAMYGLTLYFEQKKSMEYILDLESSGGKVDFVFFDTVQADKGLDASNMLDRKLINKDGLLVFHDTSELRFQKQGNPDAYDEEYQMILSTLKERQDIQTLCFPFSRGLTIMRYLG